jgi:hypothetical protein
MSGMLINLVISLLSGAGGARLLVGLLKKVDLGPVGNMIVGALGGLAGAGATGGGLGSLLGGASTAAASSGFDIGGLVSTLAGGGIGGAVLQLVVGLLKNALFKR